MFMATAQKKWTLEELHSLPDDGNKYELIRGELFVTPAPTDPHETAGARLTRLLVPYVDREELGYVYHPRAVVRFEDSEVEPDLMVRQPHPNPDDPDWATAPTPSLVVEIASRSTRKRDREQKRALYMDAGVPEYWIVDGDSRTIRVVRPSIADHVATEVLSWHPHGASEALQFNLVDVFGAPRQKTV